jgi:hypothetical protein
MGTPDKKKPGIALHAGPKPLPWEATASLATIISHRGFPKPCKRRAPLFFIVSFCKAPILVPSKFNLEDLMPKPNYAFAKRQRELAKKQKKEAKKQQKANEQQPDTPQDSPAEPPATPGPA